MRIHAMAAVLGCAACSVALAQETKQASDQVRIEEKAETLADIAGDETYLDLLDTSMSVQGDLEPDTAVPTGRFRFDTTMGPWFQWKNEFRERTGITMGGSVMALWQNYSSSLVGEHNSVGSKLTLNFSAGLWKRGTPEALTFDMAVEDRRPIGTELAPLQAGMVSGSIVPTAATYGDFSLGITQAYIRQNLFENRFQYTIGKIFAPNFLNAYPFFDDNRQFLSLPFSTSPTIASPLRGFGAVAAWYPMKENGLYVKPGIFTVHSDDTGTTIDDFFNKPEHFYMFEIGHTSLARTGTPIQARAAMDANNIHATFWYKDAEENGLGSARGVAFNANYMLGRSMMWFARGGISDGWFIDGNLSVGIGWRPSVQHSDLFGIAVGGVKPADDRLRDQYTAEVFYRFHVTPNFAITPDIQAQIHPSLDPSVNTLWVFSMRGRLTF